MCSNRFGHAYLGTQVAALCRDFLNDIIFGDLNINIRNALIRASLAAVVAGTHQILAMNTGFAPSAPCIFTRYNA